MKHFAAIVLVAFAVAAAAAEPAPRPAPAAPVAPTPVAPGSDAVREQGRALTEQFYRQELDALHAKFSDEMKTELSVDKLRGVRALIEQQLGAETAVVDEQVSAKGEYTLYVRRATFEKQGDKTFDVHWALRKDQQVAAFFIRATEQPPAEAPTAK